jgi:hypothetical protein
MNIPNPLMMAESIAKRAIQKNVLLSDMFSEKVM